MAMHRLDLAPSRVALPDAGLGRGWEPAVLFGLTLFLVGFGLVTLYSASSFMALQQGLAGHYFVVRQAAGAAVGLALLVLCSRLPVEFWRRSAWPLLIASSVVLVLIVLPGTQAIAPEINGARRWLRLGITLQPSDPAKIAIVAWTAMLAVRKKDQLHSLSRGLLPFLVGWALLVVPIALEPDFSTAVLTAFVAATVVFAGGGRLGHFTLLGLLMAPVVRNQFAVGFRAERLLAFLDPVQHAQGSGYQTMQSMIALGSGGLIGQGFGEGRQKYGFLPEAHNDFIFALIGEEWGLIGAVGILAVYAVLIIVGFRIARRASTAFAQLLGLGLTNLIAIHAVLHIAVAMGLIPATGLALPLVSYGRSNLVVTLAAIGILMAIARETDRDWHPAHERSRHRSDLSPATPRHAHG